MDRTLIILQKHVYLLITPVRLNLNAGDAEQYAKRLVNIGVGEFMALAEENTRVVVHVQYMTECLEINIFCAYAISIRKEKIDNKRFLF